METEFRVAKLNDDELKQLTQLESQLGKVLVAYDRDPKDESSFHQAVREPQS
jgi:hypothetical protein